MPAPIRPSEDSLEEPLLPGPPALVAPDTAKTEQPDASESIPKSPKGIQSIYSTYADWLDVTMVLFGVLFALMNGAIQPMLSIIIGNIFGGNPADISSHINSAIPTLVGLGVISFVCNYVQYTFFMVSAERIVKRMKEDCFRSLMRQEVGFYETTAGGSVGALASSISENSQLVLSGISDSAGAALQFFSQFVTGLCVAFSKDWRVALVMTVCMPIITTVCGVMIFAIIHFVKKATGSYEEAGGVAEEVLSSIQTVAAFGGETKAAAHYRSKLVNAEESGIMLGVARGLGLGVLFGSIYLSFGVGYWYGSQLIASFELDFGTVMTCVTSCIIGSISLGIASPHISAIAQARVGASALFGIIDRETLIDASAPGNQTPPRGGDRLEGEILFKDVSFRYPSRPDVPAIHQFNLHIPAGQTCALVGASGSGKSTAVSLIERFYDVESGSVRIDGVEIRDYQLTWLRSNIALVGQEPILFDATIEENIRYGCPGATDEQVREAAINANAHTFVMSFPDGYRTKVGAMGGKLSGGQKQRISIARALIKDPSILLLDEATSSLDNQSESIVQAAIDKMIAVRRRTTVIVAHRLTTIQNCDKIVVVNNGGDGGHVVEEGTHTELMAKNGAYKQLVGLQEEQAKKDELNDRLGLERQSSASSGVSGSGVSSPTLSRRQSLKQLSLGRGYYVPSSTSTVRQTSASSTTSAAAMDDTATVHPEPSTSASASPTHLLSGSSPTLLDGIRDVAGSLGGELSPTPGSTSALARIGSFTLGHKDTVLTDEGFYSCTEGETDAVCHSPISIAGDEETAARSTDMYPVPKMRVWKLNAPELLYFLLGFFGSALKGASQPCISLVISHLISGMVLIPFPGNPCTVGEPCFNNGTCHAIPHVAGNLCDSGIWVPGHDPSHVRATGVSAIWIYGLVGAGAALGILMQTYAFGLIGERLTTRLRAMYFEALLRQDAEFFDSEESNVGALLTRLATDATLIKSDTGEQSGLFFENTISLFVAGFIAINATWKLALIVLAAMPLLIFSTWFQHRAITGLNKTGMEAQVQSGKMVSESLGGIRTIYSFEAEAMITSAYERSLEEPKRAGIKNSQFCGIGCGVGQLLFFWVYAFAFYMGGYLADTENIQVTQLSKVFFALTLSAQTIGQSQARANDSVKAKIATSNIFKVVDRKPRIDWSENKGKTIAEFKGQVEFKDVRFSYPSRPDMPVLKGLSMTIEAGKTVAIVGPSGSGKSSIMKLIMRFYDVQDGTCAVLVDGTDMRDLNLRWWREQIGIVSQEPVLFEGTIMDNVAYGKKNATKEEVEQACRDANAYDFIMEFPHGFDTRCGAKGSQLSGGQKQRIAIARALIRDPRVLLLDESTSALDKASEVVVQAALDKLLEEQNRTTVVIAHRLSTIENSDKIVVVKDGEKLEEGTHKQLMKIPNGYYKHMQSMTVRM